MVIIIYAGFDRIKLKLKLGAKSKIYMLFANMQPA